MLDTEGVGGDKRERSQGVPASQGLRSLMQVAGFVYVLGQQPLARQGEGQSGLVPGRGPVLWLPGLLRSSSSWPAVDLAPPAPARPSGPLICKTGHKQGRKASRESGPGSSTKGPVLVSMFTLHLPSEAPGPRPTRRCCRHQARRGSRERTRSQPWGGHLGPGAPQSLRAALPGPGRGRDSSR
ncbi:alpha-protein kinase 3-like [Trachypithecus francoisi]|uniref:alpha-protein kinase 3-like n=1 Tax=Trachypithecus francoisi TaxID=54180 RepID=UPI00141BCAFC|nr:alpha-protein kinase 3-like [Trachypithecus francoisi]